MSRHCNCGPFSHHVFWHLDVKRQICQIMLCLKMRAPLRSYVGLAPLRSYVGLAKRRRTQSLSILSISCPGKIIQLQKSKCSRNASKRNGTSPYCNSGPFNHHVFCHIDVKRQISQVILCLKMRAPLRSYVGLAPLRSYVGLAKRRKTQSLSILNTSYPDKVMQ